MTDSPGTRWIHSQSPLRPAFRYLQRLCATLLSGLLDGSHEAGTWDTILMMHIFELSLDKISTEYISREVSAE